MRPLYTKAGQKCRAQVGKTRPDDSSVSSWLAEIVAQLAEQGNAFMLSFDQQSTGLRTPSGLKPIQ